MAFTTQQIVIGVVAVLLVGLVIWYVMGKPSLGKMSSRGGSCPKDFECSSDTDCQFCGGYCAQAGMEGGSMNCKN